MHRRPAGKGCCETRRTKRTTQAKRTSSGTKQVLQTRSHQVRLLCASSITSALKTNMDSENRWLVEDNNLPGGHCHCQNPCEFSGGYGFLAPVESTSHRPPPICMLHGLLFWRGKSRQSAGLRMPCDRVLTFEAFVG